MQTASFAGLNPMLWRCCSRLLPVLLLALVLPVAVDAQPQQAMSPSVVLVLKLVSTTHVEPTTGIVVANDGQVLVSADFVSSGGEIIVLDGGTDIIKHGRPATIVNQSNPGKLALLSVNGLARTGITLSQNVLTPGSELLLTAFPPAEYIAQGSPPVMVPIEVRQETPDVPISVSPSTPLPYVSGPLLDACGYLSGVSLTSGPQSLEPGEFASTLFADELRHSLESLQIELPSALCELQPQETMPPENTAQEVAQETPESNQQLAESDDPKLIKPEVYRPFIPKKRLNPFQGAVPPPVPVDTVKPPVWQSVPSWLLLLGFTGLAALSWKGFMLWRLHGGGLSFATDTGVKAEGQTDSESPAEAALQTDSGHTTSKLRSEPLEGMESPDLSALPVGCDGLLVIDGLVDSDMRFQRFYAVNTEAINVTIGRSGADININHPAVSHSHARLESHGSLMTLSDLGSSSGTFIREVPCLQGEIMFVEPGDEIFLGDVRIRFSIIARDTKQS